MSKAIEERVVAGRQRNMIVYDQRAAPGQCTPWLIEMMRHLAADTLGTVLREVEVPAYCPCKPRNHPGLFIKDMGVAEEERAWKAFLADGGNFPSDKSELVIGTCEDGSTLLGAY